MILFVELEVLIEVIDALRLKCNLHFGRTSITLMKLVLRNDFLFGCHIVDPPK